MEDTFMSYNPDQPQQPYGQEPSQQQPWGQPPSQYPPQQYGQPQYQQQYGQPQYQQYSQQQYAYLQSQQKDWLTTLLLCLFLGWLGVHRFYTGHTVIGVIQLLTLGGCGIWALVDFIMILTNSYRDSNGFPLVRTV
jgi:TM2 domain-containing membrane protein YozV